MLYLLLGLFALALWLVAARAFTQANTAVLARQIRVASGIASFALAAILAVRGAISFALPLAFLGYWLIWGQSPFGGAFPWGGGQPSPGTTSRVVTDHLEVELDHTTGEMRGRILKGIFHGRRIETLKPVDLALLWQDCRFNDPQSAQIVEAYLDRMHPTWREDLARGEREMGGGPGGRMTRKEALEILGLKEGASEEDVRKAHRELMLKFHPDRGGSTYLASKINEAKDVLLE